MFYPVGKQAYKPKLSKQYRIYKGFYMSLLERDTTKKEQVNKKVTELKFKAGKSKEYKVKAIYNNGVYAKKTKVHLPGVYYLITWKDYLKDENIEEFLLAVQQFKKLICYFHEKQPKKSIITFLPINSTLPIAKSTVKPITKQKEGQLANITS